MKITIKNYKSCAGNEGDAFSCTMYLDGKKAATVQYDGWGGGYRFDFAVSDGKMLGGPTYEEFKGYVEGLPEEECGWDDPETGKPQMMKPNFDIVLEGVIGDFLEERQYRRWCRSEVVFRFVGDEAGKWRTTKGKFKGQEAEWRGQVEAHGARQGKKVEEILNERFVVAPAKARRTA